MSKTSNVAAEPGINLLEVLQGQMLAIKEHHPDWYAEYEDRDPITASREHLEELIQTAPTDFASGLLVGIMLFRQQLAIITGRSF